MRVVSKMENPDTVNAADYIRQKEDYLYKREEFMQKYLNRTWPKRVICILGILQLFISLAILGVDLPILLMLGPRWQVCAGCWGFLIGFIACVSTLHSTRKLTWSKLKWALAFNIIAGIAAAVMTAFNILYAVNPYICLISGGCNYLWYTYAACKPFYTGGAILGIAFYLTAFVFVILFIKYGIGGTALFENIQNGWAPSIYDPIVPTETALAASRHPTTGPGVSTTGAHPPGMMPRYGPPPPGMIPRYGPPPPPGMMPRYGPPPPGMMPRYGPPPPGMMPRYPPPGMRPQYLPPGMVPRYPPPNMPMQGPPGSMMVRDRTASPQNYE